MWLGLSHRQAKHNEKTLELMGSLTRCEDTKERWDERSREPTGFDTYSQCKSTNKAMLR